MKRLQSFFIAVLIVLTISLPSFADFTFLVKIVNDKEIRQGTITVASQLIDVSTGRNVSNGLPSMTRFPIPAKSTTCIFRTCFFLSDFLDKKSYKKDGKIDAQMSFAYGSNELSLLEYSEEMGCWYKDTKLSNLKSGFLFTNAYLKYKAGRNHSGIVIPLIPENWLIFGSQATQRTSMSALFPVIDGAPSDPEKIIEWQYQIEEKFPGAFPWTYTLDEGALTDSVAQKPTVQSQPTTTSTTTTEVEEIPSFELITRDKVFSLVAKAPLSVLVDYGRDLVLTINQQNTKVRIIYRELPADAELLFPRLENVTFTVTCNGKKYSYDDTGKLVTR